MADIELIAKNSEQYNGSEAPFTKKAKALVEFTRKALAEFGPHCSQLEQNIALVQERVKKEAEIDESWGDDDTEDRQVSI